MQYFSGVLLRQEAISTKHLPLNVPFCARPARSRRPGWPRSHTLVRHQHCGRLELQQAATRLGVRQQPRVGVAQQCLDAFFRARGSLRSSKRAML